MGLLLIRKIQVGIFFLICSFQLCAKEPEVAVTYELSPGRFGDQLVCYLHAKWVSFHYGIPFLYKPFMHSDNFMLHEMEEYWTEEKQSRFDSVVDQSHLDFMSPSEGSLLYYITFFSGQPDDSKYFPHWKFFPVDWKDKDFLKQLRELFQPRKKQNCCVIPTDKNYLTVAIHVRRGGGYDRDLAFWFWPLRFPPDSYYLECLRRLHSLFPDRPIYVHIFTDELNPKEIMLKYQSALSDLPISFGCRESGNRHDANVMEDFFSMMNFDCLIRSSSNYTLIPSLISEYKVVMTPKSYKMIPKENDGKYVKSYLEICCENYIDEIDVDIREECLD